MEDTVVLKYGGSSVKDKDHLFSVAKRVINKKKAFRNVLVVVSAMGDTTDKLLEKAAMISEDPDPRETDQLLVTGETVSASLLAMAIKTLGYPAVSLTGFQAGITTRGLHGKQRIDRIDTKRIKKHFTNGEIVVMTGFQGINEKKDFTTLGRGGSDTSAVAVAAALDCPCEIYTDVDGVYTVDPRLFPEAKRIDHLTFQEAMEMASLGAGVIASRAVEMAAKYDIPLYIGLNRGKTLGTRIEGRTMEKNTITNISVMEDILLVDVKGEDLKEKSSEIFKNLADGDVNLDVISMNTDPADQSIYFTTTADNRKKIENLFEERNIEPNFKESVVKISVIGDAMRNQTGIAARAFGVLLDNGIDFYQVSTSEISISYIIDAGKKERAVTALAREFNL